MKTALVFLGMMVLVTPPVQASVPNAATPRFINATLQQSEQSLKCALESDSPGLRNSAAQTVHDLTALRPDDDFTSLVIPLMRIVKNEDAPAPSRIVAAIALHDLRSSRGDYAIKQTARFTRNERVKHVCEWLTYYRTHGEGLQPERHAVPPKEMLGMIHPEPMEDMFQPSGS